MGAWDTHPPYIKHFSTEGVWTEVGVRTHAFPRGDATGTGSSMILATTWISIVEFTVVKNRSHVLIVRISSNMAALLNDSECAMYVKYTLEKNHSPALIAARSNALATWNLGHDFYGRRCLERNHVKSFWLSPIWRHNYDIIHHRIHAGDKPFVWHDCRSFKEQNRIDFYFPAEYKQNDIQIN